LTLALDANDLPCFLETRSGGVVGRTIFEAFNTELAIEAPEGAIVAATPAAATPVGRD
jgi:hypothetical protein